MGKISLLIEKMTAGGGGWDDIDVVITDARTDKFTYNGTQTTVPAIILSGRASNGDVLREEMVSAGKLEKIIPSADGCTFESADSAAKDNDSGVVSTSNVGRFLASLKNGGASDALLVALDKSVKALIGVAFRAKQVNVKASGNITKDTSYLTASKVYDPVPDWAKGTATTSAAASANASGNGGGNGAVHDEELEQEALGYIIQAIQESGAETMKFVDVNKAVFKLAPADDAARRGKITRYVNLAWMGKQDSLKVEKGSVSLA